MLSPNEARKIAIVLHYGRVDWSSLPEIGHLERVADNVTEHAQAVAWLHDCVEDGLTTMGALREAGLDEAQYNALFLLTRQPDETYLDYIRCIARADGTSGALAREVKMSDLADNTTRPCPADKQGMRRPGGRYDKARQILLGERP